MGIGAVSDSGTHIAPNGRVRLFWGNSQVGHDGPSGNEDVSVSTANDIISAASVSQAAMRAEMPQAWRSWYGGLSQDKRDDIYASLRAHPGYVT